MTSKENLPSKECIRARIAEAKAHAMSVKELYELEDQQKDTLTQKLDREQYKRDIAEVTMSKRHITFPVFSDLEPYLFELDGYDVSEAYMHEKGHFDQAVREGFTPLVGLYFINNRQKSVQLFTIPTTIIPETMTDTAYYAALERVIRAVGTPSESDHRMLSE